MKAVVGGCHVCFVGILGALTQVLGYKYLQVSKVLMLLNWTPLVHYRPMKSKVRKDQCSQTGKNNVLVQWRLVRKSYERMY